MASRYWVGGGSANTWAATGTTNWAATSGGAADASVPGTSDMAVFDSNSGSSNSVISANITVQGLECDGSTLGTGAYAGTITHNTGVTLTINTGAANSLRFSAGMTYTPASTSSIVVLTHTSGTANIKSYGKSFAALQTNGVGGTTQVLDAVIVNAATNSTLTISAGTFDANNGAGGPYAITANLVISNNSGSVRSLILGGTVTIGGNIGNNLNIWNFTSSNLTFTKNSANIIMLTPASPVALVDIILAGLTYNNWTFNTTSSNTQVVFSTTATVTLANLTVNSGWGLQLTSGQTYTISNPFSFVGTQANPVSLTTSAGTLATLSCPSGACTLNWGALQGITGSGGAMFTATNTLNLGTNAGWSISPPNDSTLTPPGGAIAAMARGTVTTGASTTSVPTSALTFAGVAATGVVSNQFVGRSITFDGATTTAGLQGVSAVITATSISNTPTFTVATLPATPVSGDLFTVV